MRVSVIIPSFDEKEVLEECVESLGEQSYPNFEIVIVDDGSTDGTLKILENLARALPNFKYVHQPHRGAGAARNLGAKQAKGEILVFVDADMTFDKNFLESLTHPIITGESKGTFSKEEIVENWDNNWAKCWSINEGWQEKRRHPSNYPNHQAVFRAILKSEFDRVGGFTPGGYDDDWSLSKKLRYEATNAPGAIFYHKNPSTLTEVFNHSKWVGKRRYKLGALGEVVGLLRASLPFSIIIGVFKSLATRNISFILFKIVYDFGIFVGISEHVLSGKQAK